MRRAMRGLYVAVVVAGCLYLAAPTILVALASFSSTATMRFPPEGLSLRWYANFFARPEFVESLKISFVTAVAVALVSTAVALGLAIRFRSATLRMQRVGVAAILLPAVLPTIVLGPALLVAGADVGLTRSFAGTLVLILGAHVALTLPFAWQAIATGYAALPPTLEEAAAAAGAGPWRTLRRVVVPMMLPAIVASMAFTFLVSFDEPVVSLFLTRHDLVTLPAQVFTYLRFRADPTIAALSTMTSLLSLLAMWVADRTVGLDRIMGLSR